MPGIWGVSPRQSVGAECSRRGTAAVVAGCVELLQGREPDEALVLALGGPHAEYVLGGGEGGKSGYWPRVWACRGLLYAWDDSAGSTVIAATSDESWRVREMAAKVIARRQLRMGVVAVAAQQDDPVPRVRAAAERALAALHRQPGPDQRR